MKEIDLTNYVFSNDRTLLRKELIDLFVNESPGRGTGDLASRNIYKVKVIDNKIISLKRPAQFNKGIDFTLNVSEINFNDGLLNEKGKKKKYTNRPSHNHIKTDLKNKKKENPELYRKFFEEIEKIYNCEEPTKFKFSFKSGYSSEIILECIKWLFIEQDITYWHYSGREMFYKDIKNI